MIGGNVSLYNASGGNDIDPTPVVAVLGVIDDLERRPPGMGFAAGSTLVLLGDTRPARLAARPRRWRIRWAVSATATTAGRCPRSTSPPTPACWPCWSARVRGGRAHLRPRRLGRRAGARPGRDARCVRGWAASSTASAITPSCSRSPRRGWCSGTEHPDEVLARAQAAGVPARASSGRRAATAWWSPGSSTWPSPMPSTRGAARCPARWARPSPTETPHGAFTPVQLRRRSRPTQALHRCHRVGPRPP